MDAGNLADSVGPINSSYFSTTKTELYWHLDTISYFLRQDHYHNLNFWIPIIKPDRTRSGLSIIPMDRLQDKAPDVHAMIFGRGAARFLDDRIICERDGRVVELRSPCSPDSLAETPHLGPGDALVVRSDLFHRTQDLETDRVALSIRAYNSTQVLDRNELLTMSQCKYERMLLEKRLFMTLLMSFKRLGKDRITQREYEDCQRAYAHRSNDLSTRLMSAAYPWLLKIHRLRSRYRKTPYDSQVSDEKLAAHYRNLDGPASTS